MVCSIILILLSALFSTSSVFADMVSSPLPQTGQTTCYDVSRNIINCAGTGQDGEKQAGRAWPDPRFSRNGEKTITDKLTGLAWTMDSNPAGKFKTWQQALDYIKDLNRQAYLGYNDWHLPNINELESLVNKQTNLADWLHSQGFWNIQVDYYWTSTTYASYATNAWSIGMYGGIIAARDKSDIGYAWPVRNGQAGVLSLAKTGQTICYDTFGKVIDCIGTGQDGELYGGISWPSPRFVDNGDNTITDSLTGLIWTRNGQTPGPTNCHPATKKTQKDAYIYVQCLNNQHYLGKNDWRLPNRNELTSLINRGQSNSANYLNTQGFSHVDTSGYWSSTSFAYANWNAWNICLHDGAVVPVTKKILGNVWPVRNKK